MKKNLFLILTSIFFSLFFLYTLLFIKTYFSKNDQSQYLFSSVESLNFHKKYSDILNHLRNSNLGWDSEGNYKNLLYSVIKKYDVSKKNVLFQGDSWIEQVNLENMPLEKIINFSSSENLGVINAGITSFSPTLMKLQYKILKEDFNIHPNIIVAYIDQTDIGDEICRYKNKRVFDKEKNLIGVKQDKFSRSVYDYSRIYKLSEINLKYKNNFIKNIYFTNFFIKFKIKRALVKINNIMIYGFKNREEQRCYFGEIQKYLKKNLINSDKIYFQERFEDYLKILLADTKIDRIFVVTFPHRNHLINSDNEEYYKVNVSDLIDEKLKEIKKDKIKHINFTKIINDNFDFNFEIYRDGDPASHLNEKPHSEIFIQKILAFIKSDLR